MTKFKILFGVLLFGIGLMGSVVYADVFLSDAYVLKLVYDGQNIKLGSDTLLTTGVSFKEDSDLIFDKEVDDKSKGDFYVQFWIGDVYMPQKMYFAPKLGDFELEVPALPHIQELELYNSKDALLLEVDVREFAKCNTDKVCQYELGEDRYNCVADCAVDNPIYSDETKALFEKSGGVIRDEEGNILLNSVGKIPVVDNSAEKIEEDKGLAWDKVAFLLAGCFAVIGSVLVLIFRKKPL